jgi:hypothetical protein
MSEIFTLTSEQHEEFDHRGVLRLPEFLRRADIDEMADRLWNDLEERYGLRRDRAESWSVSAPAQFQNLTRSGAFAALASPKLFALADALLGVGAWDEPQHWGRPLVTFPTTTPVLPRPPWHLDISGVEPLTPLPILRIFTFLENTATHGGGTLYVAGSHRFAIDIERLNGGPVRSAQVRDRLKAEHPWFASLIATPTIDLPVLLNVEAQAGPYAVRLEEMTGAPGDLIVMHPAILHGTAHNALRRPRMMLTEWIRRRDCALDYPGTGKGT